MQEFNNYTIPLLPFYLIVILILWSLWKREKWFTPALIGLSFSSIALVFLLIVKRAPGHENFQVGFTIGMYASVVGTIPLAIFGWYLGKRIKDKMAIFISITGLIINLLVAYAYIHLLSKNATILKKEVTFDCTATPYHCAILNNRLSEIPLLKKKGMDIEAHDSLSRTALWYAINNPEAVKILLENGANPDAFNLRNETPLGYVLVLSLKPDLGIAKLLIDHGAKINRTIGFRKNISLLNFAIVNKNLDAINFALENGADPNFVDDYKKSACLRLRSYNDKQIKNLKKYCPTM